jgi:ABC-type polysaccharide/polyol phosphate export permease
MVRSEVLRSVHEVSSMSSVLTTARRLRRDVGRNWRLLALLVGRELKVKYRSSFLGYLWSMLNPLLFMMIITFVFSRLMRGVEHYDIYVLSGVLFWNMTAMSIIGSTHSLVANSGLLRKVRVPYWIFVVVPIGAAVVNCSLAFAPYAAIVLVKGLSVKPQMLGAPLVLVLYAAFLAGLGSILATLNVYFRDVGHVVEPLLQLGFYATPIIYDRRNPSIPEWAQNLLGLNPLVQFIDLFRSALFSSEFFSWGAVLAAALSAALSLGVAAVFYRHSVAKLSFRI